MTNIDQWTEDIKMKGCETGCRNFTNGEIYHHKDCPYYPLSMSEGFDILKEKTETLSLPHITDSQIEEAAKTYETLTSIHNEAVSFSAGARWCLQQWNKQLSFVSNSRRNIADDREEDTPLARYVKQEMRENRVAYNAIAKEYPDWTSIDISNYIQTVCGLGNNY